MIEVLEARPVAMNQIHIGMDSRSSGKFDYLSAEDRELLGV